MLHYRATDVAGNASAEKMVGFTVVAPPVEDTTPPDRRRGAHGRP